MKGAEAGRPQKWINNVHIVTATTTKPVKKSTFLHAEQVNLSLVSSKSQCREVVGM